MFTSPSLGQLSFQELLEKIILYIQSDNYQYKIIIGTDSSSQKDGIAELITAIVVQRLNHGGIYFWSRKVVKNVYNLRSRMYHEALASLEHAQNLIDQGEIPLLINDIEIHVDVGTVGETRTMIKEIVGMVSGNGFPVKTKPDAYAATKVADRHT